MTIKTQGGKVITKGGKVSCECCVEEGGPCDDCSAYSSNEIILPPFRVYDISLSFNEGFTVSDEVEFAFATCAFALSYETISFGGQSCTPNGFPVNIEVQRRRVGPDSRCGWKIQLSVFASDFCGLVLQQFQLSFPPPSDTIFTLDDLLGGGSFDIIGINPVGSHIVPINIGYIAITDTGSIFVSNLYNATVTIS
jgi:hypothetical protein